MNVTRATRKCGIAALLYLGALFIGVPLAAYDEQLDALSDASSLSITCPDAEAALADLLLKAPSAGPTAVPVLALRFSSVAVSAVFGVAPALQRTPAEVPLRI